jgi:hypothetical protein
MLDEKDINNNACLPNECSSPDINNSYSPNSRLSGRRFTLIELEKTFVFKSEKSNSALGDTTNYVKKYLKPSSNCMKSFLLKRFPIISLIITYDFRNNFLKDFIAGLSVRFHTLF